MLMVILFIAALNHASSTPILSPADIPLTVFGRDLHDVSAADSRTIQDIIWSCLATIFACTWVAVHPNVSRPQDSGWVKFKQKVIVMIYAILTPEFVIAWALRQRRGAAKNTKDYYTKFHPQLVPPSRTFWWYTKHWFRHQDEEPDQLWTITHGFLLEMHGFVDESGTAVCSVDEIPVPLYISEEEINDKSKGDFLTKTLVVAQTTWFIVQCIARLIIQLPVTELEVVTLAFALLNIGTYALWWNKPQNMGVAIRMARYRTQPEVLQVQMVAVGGNVGDATPEIPLEVGAEQNADEEHHIPIFEFSVEDPSKATVAGRWIGRLSALTGRVVTTLDPRHFLPQGIKDIIVAPFKPLMAMAIDPQNDECDYIFYSSGVNDLRFPLFFMIIGTMFGGLHLLPLWSASFPSSTENILWRVFACWIVCQPALGFCSIFFAGIASEAFESLIGTISLAVFGLYLIARIILVVLAFTTLRRLPPETFQDISWTTFFPHV